MYRYETHLHTSPVSRCAGAGVREQMRFYRELGYDGIFVTNHFLDGNVNIDRNLPYKTKLDFYLSDYFDAKKESENLGIKVFFGVELSHAGTDFLIYGLPPEWYQAHPEIMELGKKEELALMRSEGAFVVQAHPYREAGYIDHIRLYPRSVDAVEVINASRIDFENRLADQYADNYGLLKTGGSDNHHGFASRLAGMECEEPVMTEADYGRLVREGKARVFTLNPDRDSHEWFRREPEGSFTVQLRTNPSTGFDWDWEADPAEGVAEESKEYVRKESEPALCGAPSFVRFVFRTSVPGMQSVTFRYRRSWESTPPLRTFKLRFELKEDGRISLPRHDFTE